MIVDDNGMCLLDDEDMSYHTNTVVGAITPIKKTNADRIRAMTDEELAKFIAERNPDLPDVFAEYVLEWLKKEVDA